MCLVYGNKTQKTCCQVSFLTMKSFISFKAWESHVTKEAHYLQLSFMALNTNMFFSFSCNMCIHTHITLTLHYVLSKTTTRKCCSHSSQINSKIFLCLFFSYAFLSLTVLTYRQHICLPTELQL